MEVGGDPNPAHRVVTRGWLTVDAQSCPGILCYVI